MLCVAEGIHEENPRNVNTQKFNFNTHLRYPLAKLLTHAYGRTMNMIHDQSIAGHAIVAAITHNHTRLWLLNDEGSEPVLEVLRDDEKMRHDHIKAGQSSHMHQNELGEIAYFEYLAEVLNQASSLVLLGHGKGKGNAMERFVAHIEKHRSSVFGRIVGTGVINLPHLSDGEVIAAARSWWSRNQAALH